MHKNMKETSKTSFSRSLAGEKHGKKIAFHKMKTGF